jgi:glycosyltransferase involved in cell wall biosynthesis
MRITFVLPGLKVRAVGAHLVIYRYANELHRRGHEVRLVHSRSIAPASGLAPRVKASTWRLRKQVRYRGRIPWFPVDSGVKMLLPPDIRERHIPDGDAVFATDCTVTPVVATYGDSKGRKFNLVQAYEDWTCGEEGVHASWRMPLHKVVVSRWLEEAVLALGEAGPVTHIPPGIELETFRVDVPPRDRVPFRVGMLAHDWSVKGMTYAIEALSKVREVRPELQAVAFGRGDLPAKRALPPWVEFVQSPSRQALADLYNSFAIFLHSSVIEGWPMPPAEALACGCALVASDSRGVRDYAVDGETALVVPVRDSDALAAGTLQLMQDDALRLRLATAGRHAIEAFPAMASADRLEGLLLDLCREGRGA